MPITPFSTSQEPSPGLCLSSFVPVSHNLDNRQNELAKFVVRRNRPDWHPHEKTFNIKSIVFYEAALLRRIDIALNAFVYPTALAIAKFLEFGGVEVLCG